MVGVFNGSVGPETAKAGPPGWAAGMRRGAWVLARGDLESSAKAEVAQVAARGWYSGVPSWRTLAKLTGPSHPQGS